MKKVILVTSHFPYLPGEQFLETEVKYYNDIVDLTILPLGPYGFCRSIPEGIKLDDYFLKKNHDASRKIYYLIKSLLGSTFYKELFSKVWLNKKRLRTFLASIYAYQMYYEMFNNYFNGHKGLEGTVVYTYWNAEATYALQSLKTKYKYKLVSRIHRFDIYKEHRLNGYMPLKSFFTKNIDSVFTITQSANEYLSRTYGFEKKILKLSRLGVDDKSIECESSRDYHYSIASCSFLSEVKRVDKIIGAISVLAENNPAIKIKWNHIGNGPLLDDLKQHANKQFSKIDNLEYNFLGYLDNEDVYGFYRDNSVDVFVNTSDSEGVPVSIMEAMSCHVPVIAPDIGGVSDMIIDQENGRLLSKNFEIEELVSALSDFSFFKEKSTRKKSYKTYTTRYCAKQNYNDFVMGLIS